MHQTPGRCGECQRWLGVSGPFGGSGPSAHPTTTWWELPAGCWDALPDRSPKPAQGVGQKGPRRSRAVKLLSSGGGDLLYHLEYIIFIPTLHLTSSADEHLQIWLWSFRILLPLSGQVPTSCGVGRRHDVTILQMQQSGKPSAFSLNHWGMWV